MKTFLFLCFTFLLFNQSCTKDKSLAFCSEGECSTLNVSYQTHIKPIIANSCSPCHVWIHDYDNLLRVVKNGTLEHEVVTTTEMPPLNNTEGVLPLTTSEIAFFKCWICVGAPNN